MLAQPQETTPRGPGRPYKGERQQTHPRLDPMLYAQAKAKAKAEGKTYQDIVEGAVKAYVASPSLGLVAQAGATTASLSSSQATAPGSTPVDPLSPKETLPDPLRQPGLPQDQRLYHEKEWREAAGEAAQRKDPLLGKASQSPWETEGGATRKDLRAAEKSPKTNCWQAIIPALKDRVSEQNFEIWLSGVKLLAEYNQVIELQAPNAFFVEYLTEHYREVVEEQFKKRGDHRTVLFRGPVQFVAKEETKEIPAPPPKEEKPLTKRERREKARDELKEKCTTYQNGRAAFLIVDYQSRVKLLEAEEAEEDRREAERSKKPDSS